MAAMVTSVPSEQAKRNTFDVNVTGSFNVASLAIERAIRFCYFSTTVKWPSVEEITEKTNMSIVDCPSLYGLTKHLGEEAVTFVYKNWQSGLLVVRPCFTYGSKKDYSVVRTLIKSHYNKEYPVVRLDPHLRKDYTHISDFSSAVGMLIESGSYGDYNITSGEVHTFQEILDMLKEEGIEPRM